MAASDWKPSKYPTGCKPLGVPFVAWQPHWLTCALWTIDAFEKHHAKCHIGSSNGFIPTDNMLLPVPCTKNYLTRQQPLCCYLAKSIAKLGKKIAAAHMFHEFQYSKSFLATHVFLKIKLLDINKNMCVHGACQHIIILKKQLLH